MFISKILIKGFRNFNSVEIEFNDGLNVIIGHNNSGKSNLFRALSLVLDHNSPRKLAINDFNKSITLDELKQQSPAVKIEVIFKESEKEIKYSEDLAMVAPWLTNLASPYTASLTYEFFLPECEKEIYLNTLSNCDSLPQAWEIINEKFIRLYIYKIFGGDNKLRMVADNDIIKKIDFQFLNAIRDVERDLFSGKNTLLKEVIGFFIDYEIKNDNSLTNEEKQNKIESKKKDFGNDAAKMIVQLSGRMQDGKKQILEYANETGASFNNAKPDFEGSFTDVELFSFFRLIINNNDLFNIPATHNGLGYNNLIFMSLLLAKMQANSDGKYYGSNAKTFPILLIEEPEAHLHPSMQYKFLKFLRENKDTKKVRQVFVTSHSTQITATVPLDEIICLYEVNNTPLIGYPSKVFELNENGRKSKAYVERFLDSTKSDMLFAKKVIFVEGIAEQLLIPVFFKIMKKELENQHIIIVNIGGNYFNHFLKIFNTLNPNAINKKIACIFDFDPQRKKKNGGSRYEACYPFEYKCDETNYDYKENNLLSDCEAKTADNIKIYTDNSGKGKTFEYQIALENPDSRLILTSKMRNFNEIESLINNYIGLSDFDTYTTLLSNTSENNRIKDSLSKSGWDTCDKKKALFAARYLNSISKGENAFELADNLEKNLNSDSPCNFNIPSYIKDAIEWICQ